MFIDVKSSIEQPGSIAVPRRPAETWLEIHAQDEAEKQGMLDILGPKVLKEPRPRTHHDRPSGWRIVSRPLTSPEIADIWQQVKQRWPDARGKDHPPSERFHRVTFILADEQYDNVQYALGQMTREACSEKEGHLLDAICTSYLAGEALTGNCNEIGFKRVLRGLERTHKVQIMSVRESDDTVIYTGSKMAERLRIARERDQNNSGKDKEKPHDGLQ